MASGDSDHRMKSARMNAHELASTGNSAGARERGLRWNIASFLQQATFAVSAAIGRLELHLSSSAVTAAVLGTAAGQLLNRPTRVIH
jgi:hypothetical protein